MCGMSSRFDFFHMAVQLSPDHSFGKKKKIKFPHRFVWKLPFSWNNFPDVVGSISEFSFGPVGLSVYSWANTKLLITGIVVYVDGGELGRHMALLLGSSGFFWLALPFLFLSINFLNNLFHSGGKEA